MLFDIKWDNYVSMAEGGGSLKMLTDAHVREGVYLKCLREHFDIFNY